MENSSQRVVVCSKRLAMTAFMKKTKQPSSSQHYNPFSSLYSRELKAIILLTILDIWKLRPWKKLGKLYVCASRLTLPIFLSEGLQLLLECTALSVSIRSPLPCPTEVGRLSKTTATGEKRKRKTRSVEDSGSQQQGGDNR